MSHVCSRQNQAMIPTPKILDCLRTLGGISTPLWLTGGVSVDFLVGRWTRSHKDIDLVALSSTRELLAKELSSRGVLLVRGGAWNTWWSFSGDKGGDFCIEIVFVEGANPHTGALVIPEGDPIGGRPGRYPLLPEYLDPLRFATLDGVRFRVCSAEGEWLARMTSGALVPGRTVEPKIVQDIGHLEPMVPEARRRELLPNGRGSSR